MELTLNSKDTLSRFLADVERRAFKMAKFASHNTDEALDLVQETMFEFVRRYSARPGGGATPAGRVFSPPSASQNRVIPAPAIRGSSSFEESRGGIGSSIGRSLFRGR